MSNDSNVVYRFEKCVLQYSYAFWGLAGDITMQKCRRFHECQLHKLLRPNVWLDSFERKYCILFASGVFEKNNESF